MRLDELASHLGCDLHGDPAIEVAILAPLEDAQPGSLSFLANPKYRGFLATTRASAVVVARSEPPLPYATLRCDDPYLAFARAIRLFHRPVALPAGVAASAVIASDATVGPQARIGPHCVIGAGVVIGARACLDANVVIYPETIIGDDFHAYANVVVRERVRIGDRVILQPGCVIGSDGFGYVPDGRGGIEKIVQSGIVVIEDGVEIGANSTIDRAAVGVTRIGRSVKIDNLVQVAHGCSVGAGSLLAAQVGLSGSTHVGRGVRIGGQAGTAGHQRIGDGAQIAAQSGVPGDVAAGATVGGYPAEPIAVWRRIAAALPRLPELFRRVRRLEARLERDEGAR